MSYFTPFQVAVIKQKSLKDGGVLALKLDYSGVKNWHKQTVTKTYDQSAKVVKIRCTVSGEEYGYDIALGGTVETNITLKPSSSCIEVHMKKTSEFTYP